MNEALIVLGVIWFGIYSTVLIVGCVATYLVLILVKFTLKIIGNIIKMVVAISMIGGVIFQMYKTLILFRLGLIK